MTTILSEGPGHLYPQCCSIHLRKILRVGRPSPHAEIMLRGALTWWALLNFLQNRNWDHRLRLQMLDFNPGDRRAFHSIGRRGAGRVQSRKNDPGAKNQFRPKPMLLGSTYRQREKHCHGFIPRLGGGSSAVGCATWFRDRGAFEKFMRLAWHGWLGLGFPTPHLAAKEKLLPSRPAMIRYPVISQGAPHQRTADGVNRL